jgi:NADPH2:quinone reductase
MKPTMKTYLIRTRGDAMQLDLHVRPIPVPASGELLVRVKAAALNRGEFVAGHGLHAPDAPPRPAGFEAAGEVIALGDGATGFSVGDRVMGRCDAAFSEFACMAVDEAMPVPARFGWEHAACATVVYLTAHDALILQGHVQPGEWVLIAGASSGVGVATIQLAKALGARTIGTSASGAKLERLAALGLDVGLQTRTGDFVDAVREATGGRGADIAVNNVGGSVFPACVEALGFEGRLATVGYVDGVVHADMDIAALHKKRLCLFGVSNKMRTLAHRVTAIRRLATDLMPYFEDGRIVPVIDRVFPFAALDEAKRFMEGGEHLGKIVVRMDD